ncbi:MAG: hypothetical protein Q8P31_08375 [Bacillota bacterium]|nr:hypothetical protein [Bacillota bacterium]
MAVTLGFVSLLLAALACFRAHGARRHTRRLQATLEEMIALMELLSERYPGEGIDSAGETAEGPAGRCSAPVTEEFAPAADGRAGAGGAPPCSPDAGAGVRQRVAQLDANGASRSAICREIGLSQGEVKLMLAMYQRIGGAA